MADLPEGVTQSDLLYGFIPTLWICILFVVLFAVSSIIHLAQSLYFKLWWLLPTAVLAGIGEVIGWAGRLWSSQTYLGGSLDPYLMQICATIVSPTPLLAANFVILGVIISHLGPQYSRLPPRWYSIVFCTVEIAALIVQAVGGASASTAAQQDRDPSTGGNIMLAGIVLQLAAITLYVTLGTEFFYRYLTDKPLRKSIDSVRRDFNRRLHLMVFGLALSTTCLFIRAIYRTLELAEGWDGRILRTEVYFNVLDGGMIVLAIYTLNFLHPGFLLPHTEDGRKAIKDVARASQDNVTLSQQGYDPSALEKAKDQNVAETTTKQAT